MKIHLNKIASLTLVASMILSVVSPSDLLVMASGNETEVEAVAATETEHMEITEGEETDGTKNAEISEIVLDKENPELVQSDAPADEPESDTEPKENLDESETVSEETEQETKVAEEIETICEPVTVSLERELSTTSPEEMKQQAGAVQKLKVSAINPSKEDAALRLYFWEYEGENKNGNMISEEELTVGCMDVQFPDVDAANGLSVKMTEENGTEFYGTFSLQEEIEEGICTARYLEADLPAGCQLLDVISVWNDQAETVVVDAVVYPEEMMEEGETKKCVLTWNEVVEKVSEGMEDTKGQETDSAQISAGKIVESTEQSEEQGQAEVYKKFPEWMKEEDFSSKRLLVILSDEGKLLESDQVIGKYDEIYLIEYESVEACMEAYLYYTKTADAVEPDTMMEIASDTDTEEQTEKEDNPVMALSATEGASFETDGVSRVIALLDTGASASENVVDRVSLIDDVLEGHSHGNQMVSAITGENPDAKILSIRVMGNDGRGSVSAIVSGMEYAMEHGASIINLSLSSKKNLVNAVLEAEIQKAAAMGIFVVGAAGNNASDVADYMPGSVAEAYIIGACTENGVRLSSSNYGTTVDYNVVADTTSQAAAKFSGCLSRAGLDALKVNEGVIYTTDYVAKEPDAVQTPETGEEMTEDADDLSQEADGIYPGKGCSVSQTEKIWARDTAYDLTTYNPYPDDENVSVRCESEIPEYKRQEGEKIEAKYICSLNDDSGHWWNLYVTFIYTEDRSIATVGSSMLEQLMPAAVNQERNAGYGGVVPEYTQTTVDGREYTVLKDDAEFDVNGLLIDYNPETFKVNNLTDDGGFDITKPGSYFVTYEMSYFLYPDYTWYVKSKVNVVERESLERGIYLTTSESTLLFKRESEDHYSGYGDLVKMEQEKEQFTIRCVDPEYEVAVTSSSETVTEKICEVTNNEDGTKNLQITVPEDLTETVILTMSRPGYQSAKFFTGGGWADGDEFDLEETALDELSDTDMSRLEDTVLGKTEKGDEEYMKIAASWTTVESKNISGRVKTGDANTVNYSWVSGRLGACNTGTVMVTEKKDAISSWISEKGYDIDTKDLKNFKVNCSSGHDYLALWPNSSYKATLKCYIQKKGDNYRLKITCSLNPGSDSHGNYQGFYGSKTYTSLTNGARLRVYKRFADPDFMDINPDKYGYLKTTFAIYPASAYNPDTKVLDTTVTPEGTISLSDKEDDSVYGDSDILDPGTYYVVETRRIAGCTQNTDIYGPVEIKESDSGVIKLQDKVNNADYSSMASNNWIYNYPMYFNGKILTKTDDSGLPVEGAIYKVEYSTAETADTFSAVKTWYFKTDADGVLAYDHAHYVASFTYKGKTYQSDPIIENAKKTVAMLPFGFVRMKEVMPPSDIYDIDANTYTIELVAKKDAAGAYTIRKLTVKGTIPTSVDNLRYWKLTVNKTSKASAEVLGLHSYSLAGATFGVFSDQACTKRVQLYSDAKLTTKVADNVFRTDVAGKTSEYYLKAGSGTVKYYVKELTAPAGHQLVTSPVTVTVTMPTDALKLKTASFTEGFSEPYDYMELDALVEKLSMNGNPVQDVVFKVCYYDDSSANASQLKKTWYLKSDAQGKVYLDSGHLYDGDSTMQSDAFYTDPSSGKIILPIGGYVTIQEVKAPAQYQVDDTVHGFTTKNQQVTLQKLYNDLLPCKIRIKKYDATGSKPLSGVEFELKFVKAAQTDTASADAYTRLLKEGETKVLATDKNGELTFENLAQGTYEITEVKTVAGQTLLKDKITVELPIAMTKAEADQYGNVDFTNAKEDAGYTGKWFFYDCLYEITNDPQFKLPQTGGTGTWRYCAMGAALLGMAGGIFIWGRKKKKTNLLSIEK